MSVIINKTTLVPSKVSIVLPKLNKSIKYNNYFYEFTKNSNEYPLEFAIKQIKQLDTFDIVIVSNEKNDGYYFIFNKTPLRKTMFVENNSFLTQLIKMKEIFNNVIILNDTRLSEEGIYKNNPEIFENVTFQGLEKLPDLIDTRKRVVIIRRYLILFCFFGFIMAGLNIYNNIKNSELLEVKNELNKKELLLNALNKKEVKVQTEKMLPNKNQQLLELNEIFKKIDEGKL